MCKTCMPACTAVMIPGHMSSSELTMATDCSPECAKCIRSAVSIESTSFCSVAEISADGVVRHPATGQDSLLRNTATASIGQFAFLHATADGRRQVTCFENGIVRIVFEKSFLGAHSRDWASPARIITGVGGSVCKVLKSLGNLLGSSALRS